jgi:AcrR family transcriptional regulator
MNKVNAQSKIINAAKQIMIVRGYKATTVDEIIQQAGVAKGSFYHAFKSKKEKFFQLWLKQKKLKKYLNIFMRIQASIVHMAA